MNHGREYPGAISLSLSTLYWLGIAALLSLTAASAMSAPATRSNSVVTEYGAAAYLLDDYPGARAAYSLRKLSSAFSGPVVRVRRSSDGQEQDFGFLGDDLDTAAIEAWLSGADGEVVKWYSQLSGHPPLQPFSELKGPLLAEAGTVIRDATGRPRLKFFRLDGLSVAPPGLPTPIQQNDFSLFYAFESVTPLTATGRGAILQLGRNQWERTTFTIQAHPDGEYSMSGAGDGFGDLADFRVSESRTMVSGTLTSNRLRIFDRHAVVSDISVSTSAGSFDSFSLGAPSRLRSGDGGWDGFISEIVFYPTLSVEGVRARYDNANAYWNIGPENYNADALLPQQFTYQVQLYEWLKSLTTSDVTLPPGQFVWDGAVSTVDELANLWLQLEGVTASSVVRGSPEWYVLNAGNGKGIEATGSVRVWHEPRGANPFGGGYGGNPPRSWANEPAFLYQLSVPRLNGSEGNPYFENPAMGRRAMVVAAVDMMMYHQLMIEGGFGSWTDMFGKALLSWAEAYSWSADVLDPATRQAFETGFGYFLDKIIQQGARAVNTNMDMFAMQAAAEIYAATDDATLREKSVQAVKRTLLGYPDGELDVKHAVFATEGFSNGVFAPAGYIMEGDQPEIFYQGESLYHLAGALAAVMDRASGNVPQEWQFLEEIIGRILEWEAYQMFFDPGGYGPDFGGRTTQNFYHGGAGFAGRTGASVPAGQANELWKHFMLADLYDVGRYRAEDIRVFTPDRMRSEISNDLASLNAIMSDQYTSSPPEWEGWSPWAKKTTYLPPDGWYTRLATKFTTGDPTVKPIVARRDTFFNKSFGAYPTGEEYWAYKNSDGSREWGFFVEAQSKQGGYGGWYGGKVETFWTEKTGVVILNRHGKTGCEDKFEDSKCHDNMDIKAGQHVWGRDETGGTFTTLLLRGQELQRTASFDTEALTPSVTVNNYFNDPSIGVTSDQTGEQTGSELQGDVRVENTFEALPNGLRVSHTVTSDETDEVTELWASIPVFLRLYNSIRSGDMPQESMSDTSIEFWDGSAWALMPEDENGDGTPELITTTALRLGRDYLRGAGPQYVYVDMDTTRALRLSKEVYEDPYQTMARVRTVHIDLHGNPGAIRSMPSNRTLSYAIVTNPPEDTESQEPMEINQLISFDPGWNIVSRSVEPDNVDIDAIFSDIRDNVVLVKDETGSVYIPDYSINEIGTWEVGDALMVNVDAATSITVSGIAVDLPTSTIGLQEGWNLLPYLPDSEMSVEDALGSILSDVVVLKDRDGSLFLPEYGIDEIGMMVPGKGYKIFLGADVTLTYPAPASKRAGIVTAGRDDPPAGSFFSGTVVVEAPVSAESDRLSVWTGDDGRHVGSGMVRSGMAVISIVGDDPFTTERLEGARDGERLVLRHGEDVSSNAVTFSSLNDALSGRQLGEKQWTYRQDGVWHARMSDVPVEFALRQNYPNPFNPTTNIMYDVVERVRVRMDVFDALGRRVAVLVDREQAPGTHEVSFDATNLGSGLYIYRMQAAGKSLVRRMMLLK